MNNINDMIAAIEAEQKAKIEELKQVAAIAEACGTELEALKKANTSATDAKNAADQMGGIKTSIWDNVLSIADKVADMAVKETREQTFTTLLHDYLVPKAGPDGKPMKLSTVGIYASTGRKVLTELITNRGMETAELSAMSYADVRKLFKSEDQRFLEREVAECGEMLRFIVKNGGKETVKGTLAALKEAIAVQYNPIKAAKDAGSRKARADKEIRDNQQQHPTAPTVVETVAGNLAVEEQQDQQPDAAAA